MSTFGLGALDALPVGLLVLAIGLSLGGTTGYAINPARDLPPRIIHALLPMPGGKRDSNWGYAWIPVVGPLICAVLARRDERRLSGLQRLDAFEQHAGQTTPGGLAVCPVRDLQERGPEKLLAGCTPIRASVLDSEALKQANPHSGGLFDFYRNPERDK